MAKTCPSCGYNPIGPFTDNCPICAEPVRSVSSDRPGRGGGMGMKGWAIGGVVGVIVVVAWCCTSGMWRIGNAVMDPQKMIEQAKAQMEADRQARTVVVSAADVLKEFEDNTDAADRKYKGKVLELSATVERSGKDQNQIPFAILNTGDDKAPIKIECFFDYWVDDAFKMQPPDVGQVIKIRGEYGGRITHLQLRQCAMVK